LAKESAALKPQGWAALGVGLVVFAAYVFAATPTPYPLDSAELAAAAFGLGVAHPPGEETTLLLAKAFTLLPLGNAAFKVALSQAAAGAAAAVLVFVLVLQTLQTAALVMEKTSLQVRTAVAAAAALAFAFAPGVVAVSDRAEVYALQTALSLGGLWLALQARALSDARLAMLAALSLGLGVGNHSLVAGLVGVGAVVAAWPLLRASPARGRFVVFGVLAFGVGLIVHAYLPLRTQALFAAADGAIDQVLWGDARNLRGLWWLVSAHTFAAKTAIVHGNATPWDLPFVFFEELELVFALLAPAGLYFLVRRSSSRPAATAIAVAAAGSMLAALVGGLDPGNPDIRGYLGPAIALVAVLSACAIATGLGLLRWSKLRALLAVLFLAGAASRFPSPSQYPGLRRASAADAEVRSLLAELPAGGALFTSHFETGFLVGYQRFVEGARPDVAWAHLAFAAGPGYAERAVLAHPELAGVLANAGRSDSELIAKLQALDEKRPVRLEPSGVLPSSVRRSLGPNGELWALAKHTSATAASRIPSWTLAEASGDSQVKAYLAWRNYIDAVWSCELGLHERAAERCANLEILVPRDERFAELRTHCR
jgi:hypothetical protein